jgi:hypothetical protein
MLLVFPKALKPGLKKVIIEQAQANGIDWQELENGAIADESQPVMRL